MAMDLAWVDAQYNLRLSVPDMENHVKGWAMRSAEAAASRPHHHDVLFGPTLDEHVDIFPAGNAGAPVHVFFHGGYWSVLAARQFGFLAPVGQEQGWTTVLVNYSLCPKVRLPEITRQIRASLAWVYRNIEDYGGNPNRIFVSGHSAGGQMIGQLLATDWQAVYGLPPNLIKGALPISGLYDLEPLRWSWLQRGLQLNGDEIRAESPIHHLPDAVPPITIAVGADETDAFIEQSRNYHALLEARGFAARYLELPGRHHFNVLDDLADGSGALWQELRQMSAQCQGASLPAGSPLGGEA